MKKIIITIIVLAVLIGVYFVIKSGFTPPHTLGTLNIALNSPMTSGAVLCSSSTSTLLVGTSTSGRNFMTISNASGVNVFLGFGYSAAEYQGTMLAASSTLILDATHSYTGAIYCIGLGANATTTYSDSNS
jgi:hypothetical protein